MSSAVQKFKDYDPEHKRLMVDSNLMISYADTMDPFWKEVQTLVRHWLQRGVQFYYPYFCLREFREHFRRVYIRSFLLGYIKSHTLPASVVALIESSDQKIKDAQIKDIRDKLEEEMPGKGYTLWYKICEQALAKDLEDVEKFVNTAFFKRVSLEDKNIYPENSQKNKPQIKDESKYLLKYGIGSVDSALMHWFECAENLDGLLTNDRDLLIAQKYGAISGRIFYSTLYKP